MGVCMFKRVLYPFLIAACLSSIAIADDFDDEYGDSDSLLTSEQKGIYFGIQGGSANMHYDGSAYTNARSIDDSAYHFAGRGFIGYAFSPFISLEIGYDYYGHPKFKDTQTGNVQNITQQGMDFVVKANLPLDYGFALYLKGGIAWVHRSTLHPTKINSFVYQESNEKFPVVAAAGIDYWFIPNMAIDFCWAKTLTISNLPTSDLLTIGLIYKINL
jgi:hypothetical protein